MEEPTSPVAYQDAETLRATQHFRMLLAKAHGAFSNLRDVPPFGRRYWSSVFQRAFDCLAASWRFQQDFRDKLAIRRSDRGDIANKIAQLFYHYYLRTSDPTYLTESRIFYAAIRDRRYELDHATMLRYYARFILVCVLMHDLDTCRMLVRVLEDDVAAAGDVAWTSVCTELRNFLSAMLPGQPSCRFGRGICCSNVVDIVLIESRSAQCKFSELSLDALRMMQVWEGEFAPPAPMLQPVDRSPGPSAATPLQTKPGTGRQPNLHKSLLYRPTFADVMLCISTLFSEASSSPSSTSSSSTGNAGGLINRPTNASNNLNSMWSATSVQHAGSPGAISPFLVLHISADSDLSSTTEGVFLTRTIPQVLRMKDFEPFVSRLRFFVILETDEKDSRMFAHDNAISLFCSPPNILYNRSKYGSFMTGMLTLPAWTMFRLVLSPAATGSSSSQSDANTSLSVNADVLSQLSDFIDASLQNVFETWLCKQDLPELVRDALMIVPLDETVLRRTERLRVILMRFFFMQAVCLSHKMMQRLPPASAAQMTPRLSDDVFRELLRQLAPIVAHAVTVLGATDVFSPLQT
jgi:hypothetical protein